MLAAQNGHRDVVEWLVEKGGDVTATTEVRTTVIVNVISAYFLPCNTTHY